jgi:hypothetical protein
VDQEDVRVEPCTFVPCPDLGHHSGQLRRFLAGQVSVDHHDIIELEIAVGGEADPVAEGSGVLSAKNPTYYVVAGGIPISRIVAGD